MTPAANTPSRDDLGECFEHYFETGIKDSAGRPVLYIRGHREVKDGRCYAWVQNARRVNGKVKEFGVTQRSKLFPSNAAAIAWTMKTASERAAKLKG